MKKNIMMRAASGLAVATLLTTSLIGGTFAKYTSSAEGSDTARVASWGFTDTSVTFDNLFSNTYANVDKNTVIGNNGEDVVAPGTEGTAKFKFNYAGSKTAPEVAYTFKVDTTGSECAQDIQSNKNIVWSLDGTEYTATQDKTSWQQMIEAIHNLSGETGGVKEYEAGKLPTEFNGSSEHTVSWKWKFDENNNDITDTNLGKKANLDSVTLKINITATQVD